MVVSKSGINETQYSISRKWYDDLRFLKQIAGFFGQHQQFIKLKFQTINKRLRGETDIFNIMQDRFAQKWLSSIQNIAKAFLAGVKKMNKVDPITGEFSIGPFTVVNSVGLSDQEAKPYLDCLKKASSLIPSKYAYGRALLVTTKELGKGGGAAAYYNVANDVLAILTDVKSNHVVYSICHEIGHRVDNKDQKAHLAMMNLYREITGGSSQISIKSLNNYSKDLSFLIEREFLLKDLIEGTKVGDEVKKTRAKIKRFWATETTNIQLFARENGFDPLPEFKFRMMIYKLYVSKKKVTREQQSFLDGIMDAEGSLKRISEILVSLRKVYESHELLTLLYETLRNQGQDYFPTNYSKTDPQEFFAECFATYCMKNPLHPDIQSIMENI